MKFRERIAPSNGAEMGCYQLIGFIAIIGIAVFFSNKQSGSIFLLLFVIFGLFNLFAWPHIWNTREKFETSKVNAYLIVLLSTFATIFVFILFLLPFLFLSSILHQLIDSLPSILARLLDIIVFIIILAIFGFLFGKVEPKITEFIAKKFWQVSQKENIESDIPN